MKGCPYPSEPDWTPCRPGGAMELYRSGSEEEARCIVSSVPPWSVPDEDLADYAHLYEVFGLDGADRLWRRLYLLHPDSRALEGVRRTDPDADIWGLLRTVMDRERKASRGWHHLHPRTLAHLASEGLDGDVSLLILSKGRLESLNFFDARGRDDAPELCRELAGAGRYTAAAIVGRAVVEYTLHTSSRRQLVCAAAVLRFMDSLPGFEELPIPQSEYVAVQRACREYPSSLWRLYDGQDGNGGRTGYVW